MPSRVRALDGARGLAALAVVVSHVLLCSAFGAQAFLDQHAGTGSAQWLLGRTPLRLLWDGYGAVYLFFVLSGMVLTLQLTRAGTSWREYYPHRLLRLYLPAWCAVAVACALIAAVPRHAHPGASFWLNAHAGADLHHGALSSATLMAPPGWVDAPLWSLKWEVLFSLLLPAYLLLGRLLRPVAWAAVPALLAVCVIGQERGTTWLGVMPLFAVGVVLAMRREDIARVAQRLDPRAWWIAAGLTLVAATAYWPLPGRVASSTPLLDVTSGLRLLGLTGLLLLAWHWPAASRTAECRPLQWLGHRSFSLYLVHEPVVVTLALLLRGHAVVSALLAVPAALLAAEAFHRVAEQPCNRIARQVGRAVGRVSPTDAAQRAGRPAATAGR